ncbi:DNA-binding ferritin-like protein (Dps family) [Runella defluvii]|uniref:DNA-binding ferritin-like protein (Dps family) n=1 Tax=Runella defluvii TaxID=370973 RepID=A0A7W6ESR5_9BACT|nr:hypothetical protein [Runella defluvii]MBB3840736.1 DNA-binding ferritin-like protein (Dps family) [Runella defluvii]
MTFNPQKRDKTLDTIVGKTLKWDFARIAKFKPHSVVSTQRYVKTTEYEVSATSKANLLQNKMDTGYNGYMSEATRRHVKGILENWLTAIELNVSMAFPTSFPSEKVYPTFVTLTLPCKQMHDDRDIKEDCFHPFMNEMIRNWKVKNYLWVSETQKNGNIHFHVLFDRAVPALRLRQIWNKHIDKFPYCYVQDYADTQKYIYRNGFFVRPEMLEQRIIANMKAAKDQGRKVTKSEAKKVESKRQKEAYEKGVAAKWKDPNTTDIHSLKSIKKLSAYVSKYFTKKPEIVKPKLAENQKLVEESGKYFIETTPDESQEVMWGDSNRVPYTPVFQVRKMRGRIWGASAALKAPETKPVAYQCVISRRTCEMVSYQTTVTNIKPVTVTSTDIFGTVTSKTVKRRVTEHINYESPEYPEPILNHVALRYLDTLRTKVVTEDEIKKASERAGPLFVEMKGEVIPLKDPQRTNMEAFAPELYKEYRAHYVTVFQNLYAA